jgi:dihydrofolate synthase / folylpolyglutamate synthase
MTYEQAITYLYSFINFEKKPTDMARTGARDLERFERLLHELGDPHEQFPVVLVAGTAGKGSVAAMMASIAHASGLKVGLFTSPHLGTIRERFQISGDLIPKTRLADFVRRISEVIQSNPQSIAPDASFRTAFELMTALALLYFSEEKVDLAILEVGLGGRLDCTNVAEPSLCLLTTIALDHVEILGNTLEAIAREKAGIFRRRVPAISLPQAEEAATALLDQAAQVGARLRIFSEEEAADLPLTHLDLEAGVQHFTLRGISCRLPLLGPHQRLNALLAVEGLRKLHIPGLPPPVRAIQEGLSQVRWRGRLELLMEHSGPNGAKTLVLADGAHNEGCARALRAALDEIVPDQPVCFVAAFSTGHEPSGVIESLLRPQDRWCLFLRQGVRAPSLDDYRGLFNRLPPFFDKLEDWPAFWSIRREPVVCFTGSLFFVGEVLGRLGDLETDPPEAPAA